MRGEPATDAWLLEAAREGDEAAFLDLYHDHRTPLFRFVWSLTASESAAEDITQECFLALLKGAGFDGRQGSLRKYLFGIARHLALRRLRLSQRECEEADETAAGAAWATGPLDDLLASERTALVEHAVRALPALQREALVLFEYEGMSLEEVAAITGAEIGAVKARLHRARESVRRRLEPLFNRCPPERSCK